jgi:hypothetical protein
MVMRIQGNMPCSGSLSFKGSHTGQDQASPRGKRGALGEAERWGTTSMRSSALLNERRQLRRMNIARTSELVRAQKIDIDTELLTGNLDEDITILDFLDIVA